MKRVLQVVEQYFDQKIKIRDVNKATEYKAKAKARAFKAKARTFKAKAINTSPRPGQGQGHTLQGQGRGLCAEYYLSYKIFLKLNFYIF